MRFAATNATNHGIFGLSREKLSEYSCPVLLAAAVCFASLYAFHELSAYVLGALYIPLTMRLFALFDKLKNTKKGEAVYIIILAGTLLVSLFLARLHRSIYGYYSFWRWFYGADDVNDFSPLLLLALFLLGGFFLASVIYYYAVNRYRTLGLMLCTMFPYFLFSRRSRIMPDALTALIVLLFLAVVIHNRRLSDVRSPGKATRIQVDRAYIISIASFILLIGAVTVAIDKPYYQAYFEKKSLVNNPFNMDIGSSTGYEALSGFSSARNANPSYNKEILFYFSTRSQSQDFLLRSRAFDIFNGEVWELDGSKRNRRAELYDFDANIYYGVYSRDMPEYGVDNIAEDISALLGKDSSHLFQMEWARLYDDSFTPEYLPAPYGIITDDRPFRFLVYYKELFDGVVYRVRSGILEDDFYFYEADRSLYDLAEALHFSSREYLDFLDSEGDREEALRLKEDYERAIEDYSDQSNISEKLTELSRQIVEDCHSDLEKARKLERYFTENGFSYSLSYVPSDNSVDYFVFESKTGYCAGYATAMTLMARAVGLPARYVEGFAAYEKDENGDFIIRDAHAHAFVEVYIPGAGWMSFDPTVAGYRSAPEGLGRFFTKLFNMFDKITVVAVVAALLLLFSLLERIKESFLRLSLPMKPVKERILSLYANLIRRLGGSAGMDFSAYTPDMLRDYLLRERGAVPEKLIALFEKTAFGGYDCSREEYREAYREYRRCYRYIRRAAKDRGPVHNP